tara:strand:+ start:644 stop:1687 length:1044 start_codon:yes stop_codon:yes gene_type:complete
MAFTDPTQFWEYLGSFWDDFEDKDLVEALWTQYFAVINDLTRTLYSIDLTKSLRYMPAILTEVGDTFPIIFSGESQTTSVISGLHNQYVTDGMLSIPTLAGISTDPLHTDTYPGQSLVEDTDYEIVNKHRLQFLDYSALDLDPALENPGAIYYAANTYRVNPALRDFYFPNVGFGSDSEVEAYTHYQPVSSGIAETQQQYEHFKYLAWALWDVMRDTPTMGNIQRGCEIARGMPFAHEAGTASIVGQQITIGTKIYNVPSGLTLAVTDGATVTQFEVLADGVTVDDNISDPTLIAEQTEWNPLTYNSKMVIVVDSGVSVGYDNTFFTNYVADIIPDNIEYKINDLGS